MANTSIATSKSAHTGTSNIKRGVSLYSFQEEYFLRKMSLEDCITAAARMGALGIEIIGEQMAPGFPNPGEAFFDNWHEWMEKYGTTPTCHDMFLDRNRYQGRLLDEDEMLRSVVRDLQFAKKLGCSVIRVIANTPPEIAEKAIPYAEEIGVKMGVEIHSPLSVDHERIKAHIETIERTGTKFLGFIPDMGIFVKRFPRVITERFVRDGAQEKIVEYIVERYGSHEPLDDLVGKVKSMGGNERDVALASMASHYIYSNPRDLLKIKDCIFHIHAKFYEMLPDYTEYSIPYEEIIPVLVEAGYSGYLSSEYEGNRHIQDVHEVDSVEQVRREQEMFKRLLGEE
jgi:sugar phosphate isomerase/epimerase